MYADNSIAPPLQFACYHCRDSFPSARHYKEFAVVIENNLSCVLSVGSFTFSMASIIRWDGWIPGYNLS